MASEVDQQIERAREVMARIAAGQDERMPARRRARAPGDSPLARLGLILAANAVILIAAGVVGATVMPLGIFGFLLVLLLMFGVTLLIGLAPAARAPTERTLREVDVRALPAQTERWLATRRADLPAAARPVADRIGTQLEALSPQLGKVDGEDETALELRRLVGEQLPAFLNDYARVPEALRKVERNGRTPDSELVAGLSLIEQEIAEMSRRLAQDDLDSLETRGRYLESKYRDPATD